MDAVAGRTALESALRKASWRLLPLLALGYLMAYTDRANISFAAQTMNRDLHFSAQVYGLGAGLFFVSYAVCEIPSNGMLLRFGARRWLSRIMVTWGLLAIAMIVVRGQSSFYGTRLLLGAAEAGYFPGVLYYLSLWFPGRRRAQAISWFYVSFPLSSVVMGMAAGPLLRLNGVIGLRGWQWLFLVEGLPPIVIGVVFWFVLPDRPAMAGWLVESEREALDAELADQRGEAQDAEGWELLWIALREPRVWGMGLFNFCLLVVNYAVGFFLPTMLGQLTGWNAARVGYLIAVSGALGAVAILVNAWHSDKTMERRWHVIVPTLLGGAIVLVAGVHLRGVVVGVMLAMLVVLLASMLGPMNTVATEVCRGKSAALAVATYNTCGMVGGFVGPYWMGWTRELTGGYAVGTGALCVLMLIAAAAMAWVTKPQTRNVTNDNQKIMNAEPELAK